MKITGNTILITGGSTGIGLALAEAFLREGNQVIICGRREKKLQEAKSKFPSLHVRVCDVSKDSERETLFQWATNAFPSLNLLINNAGIQKEVDFRTGAVDLSGDEDEIDINLKAPIHPSIHPVYTSPNPAESLGNCKYYIRFSFHPACGCSYLLCDQSRVTFIQSIFKASIAKYIH